MRRRIAGFMLGLLAATGVFGAEGSSTSALPAAEEAWRAVLSIPPAVELDVRARDGRRVRGRLLGASEEALRISQPEAIVELGRADVARVYRVFQRPSELRRLLTGIGASAGGGIGLAIVLGAARGGGPRSAASAIPIPLGMAAGAIAGYLFGARMRSRILIYEAPRP